MYQLRTLSMLLLLALFARAESMASPLHVVATTPILADVARTVAGDAARVETLLPPDADPHAFEPSPRDLARLASADLVIANGLGLEAFLHKILEAGKIDGSRLVIASEGRAPRGCEGHEHAEDDHGHDHGEHDPHVWLDPTWVQLWAQNIAEALAARDPAGAEGYRARARAFSTKLDALDAELQELFGSIPPERRVVVTDHEEFGYLADRYGIRVVGAILPNVSTVAEVSARDLAALQRAMREVGARVIVVGHTANPAVAERLARDTDAQVVRLRTHALGPQGSGTDSYIGLMRDIAQKLVSAWRADSP